jgi:hypothetical protein
LRLPAGKKDPKEGPFSNKLLPNNSTEPEHLTVFDRIKPRQRLFKTAYSKVYELGPI